MIESQQQQQQHQRKKRETQNHIGQRKKTTHIAFINIIKSLCAAAILNSTVFFLNFFLSFSLRLPICTLSGRRCVVVILCVVFFIVLRRQRCHFLCFAFQCFFFPLFQSVSFFFIFTACANYTLEYVYKVTCFCSINNRIHIDKERRTAVAATTTTTTAANTFDNKNAAYSHRSVGCRMFFKCIWI